ncbi:damage-inducible protein DinB [Deinococcus peraridilitoris]|nr:damage-inducible protein DinB [Deinococcus peraridilitoris]
MLQAALSGGAGFREVGEILVGLKYENAIRSVPGAAHTIYELLWHLEFVQRQLLGEAAGQEIDWQEQASWWPRETPSEAEFGRLLRDLQVNLAHAQMLAESPSALAQGALLDLAVHSAYHWGQVVQLRRQLGDWPAPGWGA